MKTKRIFRTGRAWAWEIDSGLCYWAEPEPSELTRYKAPSPEAKVVRVRIIKESDYQKLIKP